jgi:dolichol-phosphate mannosyltransferase
MNSLWLVLPTYNEAENLEPFVGAALPVLRAAADRAHILVVDDGSPDGTGAIADRLAAEHGGVEVLHRASKDGLGRAYLAGFARALEGGADLVLQMDADFSHDPADIGRIVRGAAVADVVIGSRYVPGGAIPAWSALRRVLSRAGCRYARSVLQVPVRDLTGGFKCFRRRVLEQLDLTDVQADGYGFQIEMTYRALLAGFTVAETPISFGRRRAGSSKMRPGIAAEALWKVPALRARLGPWPLHPEVEGRW